MAEEASRSYAASPMRTFWWALAASILVLGFVAWAIGKYGVNVPVIAQGSEARDAWQVNVAIWSLAITSVVSVAGSITAIAIANSANEAQKQSSRLQEIEVYHSHPAYAKALRIVDAHLATKATLQLILTGLVESRRHALVTATANPWPMINRWRSFSADLHRSVFESELYAYLLSRTARNPQLVPWAVATILSTAADLESLAGAPAPGTNGGPPLDERANRSLFERNALAYIAAGRLLQMLGDSPSVEDLYKHFGGSEPVPYRRVAMLRDPGEDAAGNLGAIRALTSEYLIKFQERFGLPVWTTQVASEQLASSLRDHFDPEREREEGEGRLFTPFVMADVYAPFVAEAIDSGLEEACRASQKSGGPLIPGVAERVVRISSLEECLDYVGSLSVVDIDVLALPRLMGEAGERTKSVLDEIAAALDRHNRNALFVFTSSNELRQAELFYLASRVPKSVVVWDGWPYVPNDGVAMSQLLGNGVFSTASGFRSFSLKVPIIFTGALPLFQDPESVHRGPVAEKIRGHSKLVAVTDIG